MKPMIASMYDDCGLEGDSGLDRPLFGGPASRLVIRILQELAIASQSRFLFLVPYL